MLSGSSGCFPPVHAERWPERMFTLLAPPIAFSLYLLVSVLITGLGRLLAGPGHPNALKNSTYAGGEAAPLAMAAPSYGPSFVSALFFGVLHLGILVVATSALSPSAGLYLLGLFVALLVLILG